MIGNNSGIRLRVQEIQEYFGLSGREFSKSIGKSPSYIKNMTENVSLAVLNNILLKYPDINITWLITGEGSMIKKQEENTSDELQSELKRIKINYDEMKKERDEYFHQCRILEEKLEQYESPCSKTNAAS